MKSFHNSANVSPMEEGAEQYKQYVKTLSKKNQMVSIKGLTSLKEAISE